MCLKLSIIVRELIKLILYFRVDCLENPTNLHDSFENVFHILCGPSM